MAEAPGVKHPAIEHFEHESPSDFGYCLIYGHIFKVDRAPLTGNPVSIHCLVCPAFWRVG